MASLSLHRTLSSLPLNPQLPNPNPNPRSRSLSPRKTLTLSNAKESERGIEFETGDSFFRRESAVGRDLGVLAAVIHGRNLSRGPRVLDAMCGCGVRALRYLSQAGAGFVWANDAYDGSRGLILSNLAREPRFSPDGERRWVVTHLDANRVLFESYLQRKFFDLVDVDSFGSDSSFLRSSMMALKKGGLLYATSTDGYSSGGHRPQHSLASYGAYVRPMPYSNEVGLRLLIGGALREASALGFHISPLFSYYSYHGPVFRVMFKVDHGMLHENLHYGFISYCHQCGNSQAFPWEKLGQICCPCNNGGVSRSVVVSGPLWTGPLHNADYLTEMLKLAEVWGWAYTKRNGIDLQKLLNQMIDESNPLLPFGYIKLDEVASRAKINSPPVSTMINALQKQGYAATRSHIAPNAIKTNCPMGSCIQIAKELRHAN
ncbi:tRNA methyltransferase Trm1 protein [Dioscorea alata]|uniref:tRNA methyltransferase Trm1 protein n=2 Tax=Dioscorea alata TaxID=55571 RepID=A0ACB7VTU0_DIOAL|nr:tRNA methyltransferase Trm1 protein [Dioscorea alata]KAH7677779.1 tRNA methyltransferase Trm1 protein [Dioscorea alata]